MFEKVFFSLVVSVISNLYVCVSLSKKNKIGVVGLSLAFLSGSIGSFFVTYYLYGKYME